MIKKFLFFAFGVFGFLFLPYFVSAAEYTVNQLPSASYRQKTFNNLVFDFTITSNEASDILLAFTVDQIQSARDLFDLAKLTVYRDVQEAGFQGYGVDKELGILAWNGTCDCYYVNGLNEVVPPEGLRIFISAEIASGATDGRKIQVRLLPLLDTDLDGAFDIGESGVFFSSRNNGPSVSLDNTFIHDIAVTAGDVNAPLAVITSLEQGQTVSSDAVTVSGVSKDMGGSNTRVLMISLDGGAYKDVAPTSDFFGTWQYSLAELSSGEHTLRLYVEDFVFNTAVMSRVVTFTVATASEISPENSSFSVTEHPTDAVVSVTVRDQNNQPYSGASLLISHISGPDFSLGDGDAQRLTDSSGKASVMLVPDEDGTLVFEIHAVSQHNTAFKIGQGSVAFQGVSDNGSQPDADLDEQDYLVIVRTDIDQQYLLDQPAGTLHHIASDTLFANWGFSTPRIQAMQSFDASWTLGKPLLYRPGTLIKGSEAAVSVVLPDGKRSWIPDEATYLALGYRWESIVVIPDSELALYERTSDINNTFSHVDGTLFKYATDVRTYYLLDGEKHWIVSEDVFHLNGWSFADVLVLADTESYVTGDDITMDVRKWNVQER